MKKKEARDDTTMTKTEKQLFDLLIEIREDQAALSAMFKADRRVHDSNLERIIILEEKVTKNKEALVGIKASFRTAWMLSAAIGSVLGWLLGGTAWLHSLGK